MPGDVLSVLQEIEDEPIASSLLKNTGGATGIKAARDKAISRNQKEGTKIRPQVPGGVALFRQYV
jgi:hypothetical protein